MNMRSPHLLHFRQAVRHTHIFIFFKLGNSMIEFLARASFGGGLDNSMIEFLERASSAKTRAHLSHANGCEYMQVDS